MPPNVLHLSTYDEHGGAARAAYALHNAMVLQGLPSIMLVARKGTDDPTVRTLGRAREPLVRAAQVIDNQLSRVQSSPNTAWRSPALVGSLSAGQINRSKADVVHLHWVTDGFMSVAQIARIAKPVVWSLADMWPFSGTEHYGTDTLEARWRTGYRHDNRPLGDSGIDLDRLRWEAKRRRWRRPMTMVAASSWMEERVVASALMGSWPHERIPHLVDCDVFHPDDSAPARHRLGLPQRQPTVSFLSSGGTQDLRKGWDLLEAALHLVRDRFPDLHVAVAGPTPAESARRAGAHVSWLGHLSGDAALADLYRASDVVAVPSREDNMPLVAMEAQSCGRAVVGFAVGGLPDIVEHDRTGYLAAPFDVRSLATGIETALLDALGARQWAAAASERARATWSADAVIPRYLDIYRRVMP